LYVFSDEFKVFQELVREDLEATVGDGIEEAEQVIFSDSSNGYRLIDD
jgi:hypothetical protein